MSIRMLACALTAGLTAACAANTPPPEPPQKQAEEAPMVQQEVPEGAIARRDLEGILREGPPWLLQRIAIEEVVEGKKFVGWRIQEVPIGWDIVDLRAGDVVTHINTLALETPTDFWAAWTTLSVASEVKVAYLRDGAPLEVSVPIVGVPNPELGEELAHEKPSEPPTAADKPYSDPQRRGTIVIKGEERPLSDTLVDWSN
jgi:PDZ domain